MTSLDRTRAPWPYDYLPPLPSFSVVSDDVADGVTLDHAQVAGNDVSPHLTWSGFPAETAAFAVTCFDPDAPTGAGWWHWMLLGLDASTTELPTGAAAAPPPGTVQLRNDSGTVGFAGAAPPPGDPEHRYLFAVHALKAPIEVDHTASMAVGSFHLTFNAIARGVVAPVYRHA
ncbi:MULTISPECIES: YbhB/YbcL family Raf kinase inhibitor-like protein [Glycomyces]|uniref:Raf kinase inhibitor-like YbhB/YbcL family protein n=2 Tax=Glycomyces TaxID=58113 RepID=A0A9X3T9D8_9ACTN|nr:YbhB/YbcL family Raf kinase inhibitor-like protein [Glycomyces lechevalierae]MDA1386368.1 YbhB/YbcL family Raf kinase inhibitor-like protein [Glycomyces lechevalierae]MDR7338884.1 Raf kinase inhibitor-like YbhB/YbcL family protein [Glycomyces lechevalierae]